MICNPDLIFVGQPLIIPPDKPELPKAGGTPYYVVLPGDTLGCLARQFDTTVETLARINRIPDPDLIIARDELLVIGERPDPARLKQTWEDAGESCDQLTPMQIYGTYYLGIYARQALGTGAVPYLLELLRNSCDILRFYTIIALGRIAINSRVTTALRSMAGDPVSFVADAASLALQRIALVQRGGQRYHITLGSNQLYAIPDLSSASILLPQGTAVISIRWFIPSPIAEAGPRGGLLIYDMVQVAHTGERGFIPRVGFNEIRLI